MYIYYDWLVKVAPFYPICKFPASFFTPMENADQKEKFPGKRAYYFISIDSCGQCWLMEGAFIVK